MATHYRWFDEREGFKERASGRSEISIPAQLQGPQGERVGAVVRNLSIDGFMAEASATFPIGQYIWLHLPEGESMRARVIWALNRRLGATFADRIDAARWIDPDAIGMSPE